MMDNNIYIRVNNGKYYSFFNSKDLSEFKAGTKNCEIKLKGEGAEDANLVFVYNKESKYWQVKDVSVSKIARINKKLIQDKTIRLKEGDLITIASDTKKKKANIPTLEIIKKINQKTNPKLSTISLTNQTEYIIGRFPLCDIVVDNPQVNEKHCKIIFDGKNCYVEDLKSINGTYINNKRIKHAVLQNYDRLSVPGGAFIFYNNAFLHSKSAHGIEIEAVDIEKTVYDKNNKKPIKLVDNISLTINAGEFIAIVGGSGAGKTTFVDCINGMRPMTSGRVLYDGNDYYENINSYRGVVGIVPQRDIMHDDISLFRALRYTANIRMRNALDKEELNKHVQKTINDVKLTGKEDLKISVLSGGQKKRVSIAMELISLPKVIFLDEPTSGLSPDLDLEMMELLKELASKGRTIVIITHSMENIHLCDKVAVIGKGGRLCYYDKPNNVKEYFNTDDWAVIFTSLSHEKKSEMYQKKYAKALK